MQQILLIANLHSIQHRIKFTMVHLDVLDFLVSKSESGIEGQGKQDKEATPAGKAEGFAEERE